jgi:hypothetical protein
MGPPSPSIPLVVITAHSPTLISVICSCYHLSFNTIQSLFIMDRTPSFYPTSEVLRMHPDWPLVRPRTPPAHPESDWTEYSRTSSRTSSYYDMSSEPSPNRPHWPFPARSSSLGSHLAGNGYVGSLHEVPWRSPPNLISAFDSDSEDEDDKPRRLVRKLKKKSSPTKVAVDRHRIIRPADDETHSLSQGRHGSKDSTMHGSRKVNICRHL